METVLANLHTGKYGLTTKSCSSVQTRGRYTHLPYFIFDKPRLVNISKGLGLFENHPI